MEVIVNGRCLKMKFLFYLKNCKIILELEFVVWYLVNKLLFCCDYIM